MIVSVALRKESVDRNSRSPFATSRLVRVALRKESVDRNFDAVQVVIVVMKSLSARRAWIEINVVTAKDWASVVALRKESVDRNYIIKITVCRPAASLSARRAWIEIMYAL